MTLVRLVGDALDKVDSKSDKSLEFAIREACQSRQKAAPIYREFVKIERDQLVHRYESSVFAGATAHLGVGIDGAMKVSLVDDCLYKPLESGPYAGEDARDILQEAIGWWEAELDWIDNRTAELRGK